MPPGRFDGHHHRVDDPGLQLVVHTGFVSGNGESGRAPGGRCAGLVEDDAHHVGGRHVPAVGLAREGQRTCVDVEQGTHRGSATGVVSGQQRRTNRDVARAKGRQRRVMKRLLPA